MFLCPSDEHDLLSLVKRAESELGTERKQFVSAATVELFGAMLRRNGIATSARDVYIEGVPAAIDLVIPRFGEVPRYGILFRPEDVLVAFKVQCSGAFRTNTIGPTANLFKAIRACNPSIQCVYVTLHERRELRDAVAVENPGYAVSTLFWRKGPPEKRVYEASGDFARLLNTLRVATGAESEGEPDPILEGTITNEFSDDDLVAVFREFKKQTKGSMHSWRLIFHRDDAGGKFTGEVSLSAIYSNEDVKYGIWDFRIRAADGQK